MRTLDKAVPADLDSHVVLDNYATPKHPKVKAWLAARPRWQLHFVPTYSAWLNLVERFFAHISEGDPARPVSLGARPGGQVRLLRRPPQPDRPALRRDGERPFDPRQASATLLPYQWDRTRAGCGCYEGCSSEAGLEDWWLPAISAHAGPRINLQKKARTTLHSRLLMVRRGLEQKQPAPAVAADFGVSERIVRKGLARRRAGGEPALQTVLARRGALAAWRLVRAHRRTPALGLTAAWRAGLCRAGGVR